MLITPCSSAKGEITVPGDKSISHRAVMLGAVSEGVTEIDNFLMSEDCMSTIKCFSKMGIEVEIISNPQGNRPIKVHGSGLHGLLPPKEILYAGNSGTTARLISGILAGQFFASTIDGDESLRNRPMKRITEPLSKMGAVISGSDSLPIAIRGGKLKGIKYNSPISSAQVKSCVLLASLYADSETTYTEPSQSRNHTELMLTCFGRDLNIQNNIITSNPIGSLKAQHIVIPGDISSAAFFIALGLITPNSQVTIRDVGLNPTRTGFLNIFKQMGGNLRIENMQIVNNELIGDITAFSSSLKGVTIDGEIIPRLIDEIPIIAVAAAQAYGTTIIKDAAELKFKESNRLKTITSELSKMGAHIEETGDGLIINGPTKLIGTTVESHNDHRIAMSLAVAAKAASGNTFIKNHECINISFPSFFETLNKVGI